MHFNHCLQSSFNTSNDHKSDPSVEMQLCLLLNTNYSMGSAKRLLLDLHLPAKALARMRGVPGFSSRRDTWSMCRSVPPTVFQCFQSWGGSSVTGWRILKTCRRDT